MKEDVLEQVVDDYLQTQGYFTRHNLRFKPDPGHPQYVSRDDSVPSDVDVIGFNQRVDWATLLERLRAVAASKGPVVQ